MKTLLVDPSLFTAPYDAALTHALVAAGVTPSWAIRPIRPGDREEIPARYVDPFFYRRSDTTFTNGPARAVIKGLSHVWGLKKLIQRVRRDAPDVVHFQWTVLPPADTAAIRAIRRYCPVVLTVHDTVPFNGEHMSFLQNSVFDLPMLHSDKVIVHTQQGRNRLLKRGLPTEKVQVVAHGPLSLGVEAQPANRTDQRWTCVLFGELKHYKGIDLLVEAVGKIDPALRSKLRVIIAGRSRMDLAAVRQRIQAQDLGDCIQLSTRRFSEQEMANLFDAADCFLFPYRQIDASGVYFLTKGLQKWTIASNVGVFSEDLIQGVQGDLLPPGDVSALARSIASSIRKRPKPQPLSSCDTWRDIGQATRRVYEQAQGGRPKSNRSKST